MLLTDCHVHSSFSSDSQTPVEVMIEEAVKRGFSYFYLTDHMDLEFPVYVEGMDFVFDPEEYFSTLGELKERYMGVIDIRPSIELGLKPHLAESFRKLLARYPFDFVIGSTHLVKDTDPFRSIYWEGRSEKEAMTAYLEAVIENIRAFPEFDSCGHLDYVIRYAPSGEKAYRYSDYADYLDTALKLLIEHGIALEVNTAGYAKGCGQPNPCYDTLKRYWELGGELLTVGSDAHLPEYYAWEFKKTEALLKEIGFKYYTVYKQRKAEMLTL